MKKKRNSIPPQEKRLEEWFKKQIKRRAGDPEEIFDDLWDYRDLTLTEEENRQQLEAALDSKYPLLLDSKLLARQQKAKENYKRKLEREDRFKQLLKDCKTIMTKENLDVIRRKHELGTRIIQDRQHYEKGKWGASYFIKFLADRLDVSEPTLRHAIKFVEVFPDLEKFIIDYKLPLGHHLTWSHIVESLLYKRRPKKVVKSAVPTTLESQCRELRVLEAELFEKKRHACYGLGKCSTKCIRYEKCRGSWIYVRQFLETKSPYKVSEILPYIPPAIENARAHNQQTVKI